MIRLAEEDKYDRVGAKAAQFGLSSLSKEEAHTFGKLTHEGSKRGRDAVKTRDGKK